MAKQNRYRVLIGESRVEEVIDRSRFITSLCPADSVDEAKDFIARISGEFRDATHNCHAYLLGPPGDTSRVGMSDDGEPHGTAGRPMLNVLVHCGVGDVAAVVTRYFGGVKLGRGGLVRAYGGAVKQAVEAAATTEKISWRYLRLQFDYPLVEILKRVYPEFGAELLEEEFGARVDHRVRVPIEQESHLCDRVRNVSGGRAIAEPERS